MGVHVVDPVPGPPHLEAVQDRVLREPHEDVPHVFHAHLGEGHPPAVPQPDGVAPAAQGQGLAREPHPPDHAAVRAFEVQPEQHVLQLQVLQHRPGCPHVHPRVLGVQLRTTAADPHPTEVDAGGLHAHHGSLPTSVHHRPGPAHDPQGFADHHGPPHDPPHHHLGARGGGVHQVLQPGGGSRGQRSPKQGRHRPGPPHRAATSTARTAPAARTRATFRCPRRRSYRATTLARTLR